ncbi:DMT family transporter [Pseudomonas costantinii]|uniref:Multidrug DMT transporter permease n=1 Tax=Pseudomonas costantinii TaxID=168469 RepID=A0A1S2UPM2_9PSED|nr:EamA family transporter [Pseudomonas costantinii]NVZ21267.1 EamA family transporter [Pseudomonas costantinii]OIN48314.1 multidrug DMT transporter permease [Pseudomonas costantinii]SED51318.1 Permease of the drug/metabolite transporter (DMT) superfamily [Pseudomonas costantinii]
MKLSDYVRLLVLAAIWGASFLFMRISAPVLGALPTAFFRVLVGAFGLIVILAILKTKVDFKGKLKEIMVLGVINSGIPFLMYSVAARLLPAGYSAIFNATTPLMGVLIGWMCFGESLTLKKGAGVLIGLIGITLLTSTGPVTLSVSASMGALACLVATSCYGAAGFLTKRWVADRGGLDAKLVAFGSQIGATLFLAPFFGISAAINPPATWGNPEVWITLVALGFICTACAYILYFRLIADIGPIRSLTVTFLVPLFGVLWGVMFLDEKFSVAHLYGGGLIGLAVWFVLSQSKPKQDFSKPNPASD